MPEGPEIRSAADRISRAIAGKTVVEVWFAFDRLQRWQKRIAGQRLRAIEPRGKAMLVRFAGGLLLDQGFLGGIGNYLRSEILFTAGIDPVRRPCDLDDDEKTAFAREALRISRRAYRTRGVTNAPSIVRELKARGVPRREYRHFVFDREDEPCYVCSTHVEKRQVAGRRLYACGHCQQ